MNKILIICAFLALIVGCASPRKFENHPVKKSYQPDALPGKNENSFTKQFQQADSMFNEKYGLK